MSGRFNRRHSLRILLKEKATELKSCHSGDYGVAKHDLSESKFIHIEDKLYYISFTLYIIWTMLGSTSIEQISGMGAILKLLAIVSLGLMTLLILIKIRNGMVRGWTKSWKQALLCSIIFFTFAMSGYKSSSYALVWTFLFIYVGQEAEIEKIAGIELVCSISVLVPIVFLSQIGAIDSVLWPRANGMAYSSYGFTHPNVFGLHLLRIGLSFCLVRSRTFKWVDLLIIALLVCFTDSLVHSRSTEACIVVAAFITYIISNSKIKWMPRLISAAAILTLSMAAIFSIYFMLAFDKGNSVHLALDNLLSGRLSLANTYFKRFGICLVGSSVENIDDFASYSITFALDNAYILLLIKFGLLPTLLFLSSQYLYLFRLYRTGKMDVRIIGLVTFMLYGIAERAMINVSTNYCLVGTLPKSMEVLSDNSDEINESTKKFSEELS